MSDEIQNALRIARNPIKPMRLHQTIARKGYALGGTEELKELKTDDVNKSNENLNFENSSAQNLLHTPVLSSDQSAVPTLARMPEQAQMASLDRTVDRPSSNASDFIQHQLNKDEQQLPQYDPGAGMLTAKQAGLMAAGMAPGAGIATAAGQFPTAEGGKEPSIREDIRAGNYGTAALKGLGAAGDVAYAAPIVGPLAGTALKAPLAAKLAMAAAPAAKLAREAVPAEKALEASVETAPAYQRLVNPAGFYSRAHEAAMMGLPEGQRTWQEMRALLGKQPGVRETELFWSGLHPEAYEPSYKLTREDIAKQIEQNFPQVERIVKGGSAGKDLAEQERATRGAATQANAEYGNAWQQAYLSARDNGTEIPSAVDIRNAIYQGAELPAGTPEELVPLARRAVETQSARDAARDALTNFNELRPMHEQYTVPGGQNYSERVLTHQYNPTGDSIHPDIEKKYWSELSELQATDRGITAALPGVIQRHRLEVLKPYEQAMMDEARTRGMNPDRMTGAELAKALGREDEYAAVWNSPEVQRLGAEQLAAREAQTALQKKMLAESAALNPSPEYTHSQFKHTQHLGDINNPILHTRNTERTGPNGERILHQEEVQSDWAQQGREKGFGGGPLNDAEREEYANLIGAHMRKTLPEESRPRLEELRARLDHTGPSIPRAPHVEDTEHWLDLAAKDTLAHAIENGFDKVFITGGQEQAKRWANELRKAVDNVRWETPNTESTQKAIEAATQQRDAVRDKFADTVFGRPYNELPEDGQFNIDKMMRQARKDVQIPEAAPEGSKVVYAKPVGSDQEYRFVVKPVERNGRMKNEIIESNLPASVDESLSAVIGGDLAKRVMAEESGSQAMKGYRMGSEGYSQTYERKYPSSFKKLLKSLDPEAKIEPGPLERTAPNEGDRIAQARHGVGWNELSADERRDLISRHPDLNLTDQEPVHGTYINITPKMREEYNRLKQKHGSVFSAYRKGGRVKKDLDTKTKTSYNNSEIRTHALKIARKYAD